MFVLRRSCRPGDQATGWDALIVPMPDGTQVVVRLRNVGVNHAFLLIEAPDGVRVIRGEQLSKLATDDYAAQSVT